MVAVSLKKKKKQKNFSLLPPTTHRSPILFFVFFFFQAEDGIRDSSTSRGLGDVYKRQVTDISDEYKSKAEEYRKKLVEQAVEQDDDIMERYLDGTEPSVDDLKACIRKGTISGSFVPILCGSAFKNKGVQPMLDAVVDYLPSPLDLPPVKGVKVGEEGELQRESSDAVSYTHLTLTTKA